MSEDQTTISINGGEPVPFNLEASPIAGELPQRVIDELVHSKKIANDYSQSFGDAVKAQAEKYKVNGSALKRYVSALAGDNVEKLREECDGLEKLLGE